MAGQGVDRWVNTRIGPTFSRLGPTRFLFETILYRAVFQLEKVKFVTDFH